MTKNQQTRLTSSMFLPGVVGVVLVAALSASASAATQAYWRFEDGPADSQVQVLSDPAFGYANYSADILDVSGNDYHLGVWDEGGAGFAYKSDVTNSVVPQTGAANNFSIRSTGGGPAAWTNPNDAIRTITPAEWTVEASFKIEDGGHRTVIGRDADEISNSNDELAALYFQVSPGNKVSVTFTDVTGVTHAAESADGLVQSFDPNGADPDGDLVSWYNMATVSDGSTLSIYLDEVDSGNGYQLVAQTDLTASGSTDTSLSNGSSGVASAGDWTAGDWSVGRGLFNGGHADRSKGYIDEVRISDSALALNELLFYQQLDSLTLEVNTTTGNVIIRNDDDEAITFDYYEVTSDSNALDSDNWTSLASQGIDTSQPGDFNSDGDVDAADYAYWRNNDGSPEDYQIWRENYGESGGAGGLGWTEAGGSDDGILSELYIEGAGTTLAPGESLNLGLAFDGPAEDLEFNFGMDGAPLLSFGTVSYVTSAVGAAPVPEPTALLLALLGCIAVAPRRACR